MRINIVAIYGGLGNQMLQFSLFTYLKVKLKNDINLSYIPNFADHNGYELDKVFNIKKNTLLNLLAGFLKKYFKTNKINVSIISDDEFIKIHTESYPINHLISYYNGCWHSKLIESSGIDFTKTFKFKFDNLNIKSFMTSSIIKNNNSISIHIRRGDYLNNINSKVFENLSNTDYFPKAIEYMSNRIQNPLYIVFSNEIDFCKNIFKDLNNIIFIDFNIGSDSWQDMALMSLCKHNIISNSTFSWWAAVLNENKKKIIVAPKSWYKTENSNINFLPTNWVII